MKPPRPAGGEASRGTYPISLRTSIGWAAASTPKTATVPWSGFSRVVSIRMVVVLPAG